MSNSNNQLERQNAVRETFFQSLGLGLNDSEVTTLLEGEALALQELLRHHSLTEIGNLLIRLDTIMQMNLNQQDVSLLSMQTIDAGNFTMDARLEGISQENCNCPSGCTCVYILGLCIKNCNNIPLAFYLPSN